jgi:hypothetical protein
MKKKAKFNRTFCAIFTTSHMCSLQQIHIPFTKGISVAMVLVRILLLVFHLLGILSNTYCQRSPFRIYTVQDGLLNLQPQAIFQDQDGFMWFGGIAGVSIYDGNRFMNFRSKNNGPRMNFLYNFFQKDKGEVWALYSDAIEMFVNRKFKKTLAIGGINQMLRTKDQRILGAGRGGIYEFIGDKPHITFESEYSFDRIFEIGNYFLACQSTRQCSILFDHSFHITAVLNMKILVL